MTPYERKEHWSLPSFTSTIYDEVMMVLLLTCLVDIFCEEVYIKPIRWWTCGASPIVIVLNLWCTSIVWMCKYDTNPPNCCASFMSFVLSLCSICECTYHQNNRCLHVLRTHATKKHNVINLVPSKHTWLSFCEQPNWLHNVAQPAFFQDGSHGCKMPKTAAGNQTRPYERDSLLSIEQNTL